MDENFQKAVSFVLEREGGYSNDPQDPGGETNWGISKAAHPNVDIKNLTRDGAVDIYYASYWKPMGCDQMPWPMDAVIFDTAVNQGPGYANSVLKLASTPVDVLFARLKRYSDIVAKRPMSMKYIRGWTNRVIELYNFTRDTP